MESLRPISQSYRNSHLDAEKALSYDHGFWDARSAKGLEWLLERRLLNEVLAEHPGPRVAIDFACGTGRVLGFMAERVPKVIGVDISAAMLDVARQRYPSAHLIQGDVTANPGLLMEAADVVTAFRFLLNAEPPLRSAALEWMQARLAPAGLLIVNFHLNPHSLRGRYLRLRRARDVTMVAVDGARALLARHGLAVRRVHGYSYLPYRRDGSRLVLPGLRRHLEGRLTRIDFLTALGSCFILVATRER